MELPQFRGQLGALATVGPTLPVGAAAADTGPRAPAAGPTTIIEKVIIDSQDAAEAFIAYLRGEADADTFGGLGGDLWP